MDEEFTDEMEVEMKEDEQLVALSPEELKESGNNCYKQQDYTGALSFYTQAITQCPTEASFYGNRAATFIMLNKYAEALEDARKSIELDANFIKGYLREAKCHLALGDVNAAIRSYQYVLQLEPGNTVAQRELTVAQGVKKHEDLSEVDFAKGEYRRALFCIDQCLQQVPTCIKFRIKKAEFLTLLGRHQESQEIANDILQRDNMNADAIFVKGMCLYYQDNIDKAFQHFQQVLRLAPDHNKAKTIYRQAKKLIAKKEEGNTLFRGGKYQEAYNIYTEALDIDPNNKFTNSKLYNNRATVCSKIGKHEQAIEDCSKAIELDSTYLKAYMRRAKCYMDGERYEEAVRDYEKIFQMDKTRENKSLLQQAKLELKKSKRKDYYKILGVTKVANEDEIKKAYRKRALVHHPDRHSHDTPEVQKEEERKFKEIGEAYAVLSDKKKRMRYDNGHDLDDLEGGGGFDNVDPNQIFQAFFGGGNGFSFGGAQQQAGGFPGGFSFQFG